MIPEQSTNIVETNATGKSFDLRIEANEHIFKAISQNLYGNRHESVAREIISNAIDAQSRANNKDAPLTIILNTEFIVEDHGHGISPEKMEKVVGVYGISDKRDTEEEIGMYGLGFKSPFAISDQFVVETVPGDGKKYVWAIYKNESGSGRITLIGESITSLPTGTKVRIPIKPQDFYKMYAGIIKYINFLKPCPITHFSNNSLFKQPEIINETENYIEINTNAYPSVLYDGWMPYEVNIGIPKGVVVKLNKKEARFSTSRENIIQTEELNKIIRDRVNCYYKDIKQKAEDNIKATSDPYVIMKNIQELQNKYPIDLFAEFKIEDHPTFGRIQWPENITFPAIIVRKNYGNRVEFSDYHSGPLQCITYPAEKASKIFSPYYKQKLSKMIPNKESAILIQEDDIDHPHISNFMQTLLKSCRDITQFKLPYNGNGGKRNPVDKSTINVTKIRDGKRGISYRVKLDENEYIYVTGKVLPYILPPDKVIVCKISDKSVKKVKDLKNWYTPQEYITEKTKHITEEMVDLVCANNSIRGIKLIIKELVRDKHLKVDVFDVEKFNKIHINDRKIIEMGLELNVFKNKDIDHEKLYKEIYKKYPMLKHVDRYNYGATLEAKRDICNYIKEKDKCQSV